ncbi:unnamed protein product [Thlaspi arvense]|uniref:Uncharacterized protein n=1 Tax=Thlaspi arvense TaxID=13288 RepID=A0AAU9RFV6_THLAR|nr:unnamed protein product [Thlaspi arvense]
MEFIICKKALHVEVLFLFFSCFALKSNLASDTITSAQPITDPETIVSANKVFELGFFSPPNTTNRYVGIWFSNVPVRSVVWVANRGRPLNDLSGIITISKEGNLVVINGDKEIIWSSNISEFMANSSARLLESGNLVLQNNGKTLWESFKYPSDTFLQKMKLSINKNTGEKTLLKSWRSFSDPSVGIYSAGMDPRSAVQVVVWNGSTLCWRSGPWNGQVFIGIEHMNSTYIEHDIVEYDKEGSASLFYISEIDQNMHVRLNPYGNLEKVVWNVEKQDWVATWSSHKTECGLYNKCGQFGSCNSNKFPVCSCLPGFMPVHEEEWEHGNFSGGCVRKALLYCERNRTGKKDGFRKLTKMKLPDSQDVLSVPESECENNCLKNCSCTAYTYYVGIGCMLWRGHLVDLQEFSINGADLYIRLASSELGNAFCFDGNFYYLLTLFIMLDVF